MRIIKPPTNEDPYELERKLANEGHELCPYCKHKAIYNPVRNSHCVEYKYYDEYYEVDSYYCENCGCKYESDKYHVEILQRDTGLEATFSAICLLLGITAAAMCSGTASLISVLPFTISVMCGHHVYKCNQIYKEAQCSSNYLTKNDK